MKNKFYEELLQLKYDSGLCREVDCSEEENRAFAELLKQKKDLPADVLRREDENHRNEFYRVVPLEISHEELKEYCILKQTKHLHTIKNCVLFFTVLAVLSLLSTLWLLLIQM